MGLLDFIIQCKNKVLKIYIIGWELNILYYIIFIDSSFLDYISSHLTVERKFLSIFRTFGLLVTIISVGYLLTIDISYSSRPLEVRNGVPGLSVSTEGKCPHRWLVIALSLRVRKGTDLIHESALLSK